MVDSYSYGSCVQDFEDERAIYEGCIYGSSLLMILAVGLPLRCKCVPREIQTENDRTCFVKFFYCAVVVCLVPLVAIPYAFLALRPKCTCSWADECEVCILYINLTPVGSCHRAATGFGSMFFLLAVLQIMAFHRKVVNAGGFAETPTTVSATNSTYAAAQGSSTEMELA